MGTPIRNLAPGKEIERTLQFINYAMDQARAPYWLCFGGLYAIIKNNGVIPDADFDICTYANEDWKKIAKCFESSGGGYTMTHAILDDVSGNALHCAFDSSQGYPHVCVSFWHESAGYRFYCHDSKGEVRSGAAVPPSGYWFKGMPSGLVANEKENFKMVEWPGIPQNTKVRVPRRAGAVLDYLYPFWEFRIQKYEVYHNQVVPEKMVSYHKGGAISPYEVHVNSMRQFEDSTHMTLELGKSKIEYSKYLKEIDLLKKG
jgi:hypothetical protein